METKITKDNLFAVKGKDNDFMTRCFDDEASYNTWLEYTTKNGNDMKSFYMIRKMSQTYSAKQRDESFQEL